MSTGLYYIIGGVKGGTKIKETIRTLSDRFDHAASILYIGASHDYNPLFERGFRNALAKDEHPEDFQVTSLNLTAADSQTIEGMFADAHIIFFDGSEISLLKEAFKSHHLKDLSQQAFERGACVGGLCAGGSYLGSTVVYADEASHELKATYGLGLIPNTTITCYIGDKAQIQRMRILEDVSYRQNETGLGVPINQTVTWHPETGFERLFADGISPIIYTPD